MLKTSDAQHFEPLPVGVLRLDQHTDFDLYFRPLKRRAPVLYREKHLPFDAPARDRLTANGITELYVRSQDRQAFHRYLEHNLGAILDDVELDAVQKSRALYGSLSGLIEDLLTEPRVGESIARSRELVAHTCGFLETEADALRSLMSICQFDYSTYSHSVNVYVFSMALGRQVFSPEAVRGDFGLGALLHDVGKSRIDPKVLNHPGRFSSEQLVHMRQHAVFSDEILREAGCGELVCDMARHHHERIEGGGYPDNLRGPEIRREVRILTIADVFDALTTQRVYKDAIPTFDALVMMRDTMQGHFDSELFGRFVRLLGESRAR